jgi:F-type H+-transporting ATPase subunit b
MADASLEERMAACLEKRIRDLGTERRGELAGHFRAPGQEVVVRSAFEMSTEARRKVIRILESLDAYTGSVRFEVEPTLICGIDIRAGGRSLAWNLEEHLGDVEDMLVEKMVDAVTGEPAGNAGRSEPRSDEHGS